MKKLAGSEYGYGDANHLDAVTSAPSYAASYDGAGDMMSRNGQPLTYDVLRRLLTWQNQVTNPTSTASYAYDGEGERVQQAVTSGGITTTTQYIGQYEEVSTTGSSTITTKYYSAGLVIAVNASNGAGFSYLVNDSLGSVSASLTSSGSLGATQLFSSYGSVRYSSGTMPTSMGYTGQRSDPSGLLYDHARYYDASVGSFISADTVQGNNRYGYVLGNPTTLTDPTGQIAACGGRQMEDGMCLDGHHQHQIDRFDGESCTNTYICKKIAAGGKIDRYQDLCLRSHEQCLQSDPAVKICTDSPADNPGVVTCANQRNQGDSLEKTGILGYLLGGCG